MFEVKSEILDSHEALLGVEFEEQTVKGAMKTAARKISRQVNIPGFRRGKAPYDKVVRFVGEMAVMQEAADALIEKHYPNIIEKAEVKPYGPGQLEDMKLSPMYFSIRVPLEPTADLGDYQSIQMDWTEPEVTSEEIDGVLEQTRQEHAVLTEVERAVQMGDQVTADIHATHDGNALVDEHDFGIVLNEENPFISEAFVEELLNLNVGDEKTFTANLPESEENEELSGAEAEFTVKVNQVQERTVPELDDALASTAGSFETLDELKEDITKRIMDNKLRQTQESYRGAWVEKLIEQSTVAYPPAMVEDTMNEMQQEAEYQLQRNQQMDLQTVLSLQGRTIEDYRSDIRPQAEERVTRSVVLMEFALQEDITVTDDDITEQYGDLLKSVAQNSDGDPMESSFTHSLRNSLLGQKTMERIEAIGRGLSEEESTAVEEAVEEAEVSETSEEADDAPEADADAGTEVDTEA